MHRPRGRFVLEIFGPDRHRAARMGEHCGSYNEQRDGNGDTKKDGTYRDRKTAQGREPGLAGRAPLRTENPVPG
jgi:hypothetical protein